MANYRTIARNYIKEHGVHCPFEIWKGVKAEKRNPKYFKVLNDIVIFGLGFDSIAVLNNIEELDELLEEVDTKYDFQGATRENVNVIEYGNYLIVTHLTPNYENKYKEYFGEEQLKYIKKMGEKYRINS